MHNDDGTQRVVWAHLDLTFAQGADGEAICRVTLSDISERKRAEEAQRESEEKYRLIVENTSDGIVIFGAENRIQYVSPAYLKQLGYSEIDELSRTPEIIHSIIHPDERETVFSEIFEAIRCKKSELTYTYRVKHLAGHYIWREDNAKFIYDSSGNYRGSYVICRDVTTRKLAEAYRDMQLGFNTALNEIAQVIISKDSSEDILESANRIIGETLQLDRALIYDVCFEKNIITGLCEWLKQEHPDIAPTKDVYPLDIFLSPFTEIRKNKHYLESHFNAVNAHFIQDGSGKILHEQMKIKSLIWYPFAFDEHGYYVFTLNQILSQRPWTQEDIAFLDSAAKQISLALIKIKLLAEKKAIAESLQVSEGKHRLVTQMRQGVAAHEIVLDEAGKAVDYRFLEVNESYERLTGLKRENIIGKTALEIQPDTESDQINKYGRVAMTGESLQYENYDKEQGKYFEVVAYSPQPFQVAVIISDISERKRVEQSLHETNAYLENLINYANAPIIVWDPQLRITRFNHALEFLTGRSEADVLGQTLDILFPPALKEASMTLIHNTLTGERWETVEIAILHRDESVRTVLWNSATLFLPDGQTPVATIAQGQDISERKQAEIALRVSEERYRLVATNVPDIIYSLDGAGNIVTVNSPAFERYGYTEQDSQGKPFLNFIHPEDRPIVIGSFIKAMQEQRIFTDSLQFRIVAANGKKYWFELNSQAHFDREGQYLAGCRTNRCFAKINGHSKQNWPVILEKRT